jgi:hypothetical protein
MMIIITVIASIVGGLGTFLLTKKLNWHALKASALLSLIIAAPFEIWELHEYNSIPYIVFGASFVGMSSQKIFNNKLIVFASLIFVTIYYVISENYNSIGGTLGTTAALSCLIVLVVNKLIEVST